MPYGFPFHNIDQLRQACAGTQFALPPSGDVRVLSRPVIGKGFELKNALAVQPMEGCDADAYGAPGEWTFRRYERFARGGAGIVWAEAIAISPESRANPNQLMITPENIGGFRELTGRIRRAAKDMGQEAPLIIAQLTHSGRFSRPGSVPAPIRAWKSGVLDAHQRLSEDYPIISDDELARLPELFNRAATLCMEAGFDGVDVKACHLYLLSELLGATGRPAPYGGTYENRTALYLTCVDAARSGLGSGVLAARINLYDGAAGNWGVGEDLSIAWDEPLRLVRDMYGRGVTLINLTMGTPYYNPHVNRPYARGGYETPESPVTGVARLLEGSARAQAQVPEAVCVATGFSYLRHFAPEIAAGLIESGGAKVAGFGRGAFAYPDFADDIVKEGRMIPQKCCVTCGLCTTIMRAHGRTGCPVRDAAWYLPELRRVTGKGGSEK